MSAKTSNCSILLPEPETAHVQRLSTETRERLLQWSKHTEVPGCSPVGPHHSIVAYLTTAFLYMCWCSFDSLTIPVRFSDKLYGVIGQSELYSQTSPLKRREERKHTKTRTQKECHIEMETENGAMLPNVGHTGTEARHICPAEPPRRNCYCPNLGFRFLTSWTLREQNSSIFNHLFCGNWVQQT